MDLSGKILMKLSHLLDYLNIMQSEEGDIMSNLYCGHETKKEKPNKCDEISYNGPSYGTFWQNEFVTVPLNGAFPFNHFGPTSPDVTVVTPTSIKVLRAGVYYISFSASIDVTTNTNPSTNFYQRISLFINGNPVPNQQASFGVFFPRPSIICVQIQGDVILNIPENSILTLVNDTPAAFGSAITTCDNGINAVTLNLFRIK